MRARKLTRKQKELLSAQGMNPDQFQLFRDLPNSLIVKNKQTGEFIVIEK